jgi:hypothetical protein
LIGILRQDQQGISSLANGALDVRVKPAHQLVNGESRVKHAHHRVQAARGAFRVDIKLLTSLEAGQNVQAPSRELIKAPGQFLDLALRLFLGLGRPQADDLAQAKHEQNRDRAEATVD